MIGQGLEENNVFILRRALDRLSLQIYVNKYFICTRTIHSFSIIFFRFHIHFLKQWHTFSSFSKLITYNLTNGAGLQQFSVLDDLLQLSTEQSGFLAQNNIKYILVDVVLNIQN
ncbi:hypothetical protein FGO68_gene11712 [Halteria grandinella]|uniref:Uncharacterized protein n=1 Tax=Halteria grandinella TaxID=5974 RepID=A0A8J8NAY6_HALGN|nr:hypothetical protein FGO68_gene11712 [Halteria grandinella]